MASSKIAVYSLPDLKNTTDDALPNYLTSIKFEQSHMLTDVRLGLGYAAVLISGVTFYFDHKLGWDATKGYTFWAVVAYFVLNSLLTFWMWGIEKGKVFVGESQGTLISFASSVKKHTPIYNLTVRYTDPQSSIPFDWKTLELSAPFTQWFTADGIFVPRPFQQWLATEVPQIAKAEALKNGKSIESVSDVVTRAETKVKKEEYLPANRDFKPPKPRKPIRS